MLIIFNKSGSEFSVDFQYDSFSQGDSNTHIVDVIVEDTAFSNYEYNAYVQFLREGEKEPSDKLIMATNRLQYNGNYYNGYTFRMGSDWFTAIAGTLKMTIEIKKYSNGGLQSNKAYGVVNIPVQDSVSSQADVESAITDEEYNAMIELINSKLNVADEKVYVFESAFTSINEFATASIDVAKNDDISRIFLANIVSTSQSAVRTTKKGIAIITRKFRAQVGESYNALVITSTGDVVVTDGNEISSRLANQQYVADYVESVENRINAEINKKADDKSVIHNLGDETLKGALTIEAVAPSSKDVHITNEHIKLNDASNTLRYVEVTPSTLVLNDFKNSVTIHPQGIYTKNEDEANTYFYNFPKNSGTIATEYFAKNYTDNAIANLIDNAPQTLDTFKEVATYIASDQTFANQITANVNQNRERITALDNTKADRDELFSKNYDELINAPEKLNIVVRDTISADTYNEAREIQIGKDKFKFGSGSKIKANEFVDGTLPTLEYLNIDGKTYQLPNYVVEKSGLKLVAEGKFEWDENNETFRFNHNLELGKTYLIAVKNTEDTWLNFYTTIMEEGLWTTTSLYDDGMGIDFSIFGSYPELFFRNVDGDYMTYMNGKEYKVYEIPFGESAQVEKHNKTINALMQRVSDLEQKAGLASVGYVQDSTLNLIRVNVVDDVLEVSGFKFDGEVMII